MLSNWKINAIRLDFLMLQKGTATAAQFREHGQDPRLWIEQGWAKRRERGIYCGSGKLDGPMQKFREEGANLIKELYRTTSEVVCAETN